LAQNLNYGILIALFLVIEFGINRQAEERKYRNKNTSEILSYLLWSFHHEKMSVHGTFYAFVYFALKSTVRLTPIAAFLADVHQAYDHK
jgi:uncharacterized membrane protein